MHRVEQTGDAIIVYVAGDLDIETAPQLTSAIELAEVGAGQRLIVSMAGCKFCDSAGLTVLVRAHKRNGSHFFVVLPEGAPCGRIFAITGLSSLFQVVPTVQRALDVDLSTVKPRLHAVG